MTWLAGRFTWGRNRVPSPSPEISRYDFDLAEEERLSDVVTRVGKLMPHAVDEATGHALDGYIDARADLWTQEAGDHHRRYRSVAEEALGSVKAEAARQGIMHGPNDKGLRAAETAVEQVLNRAAGQPGKAGASGELALLLASPWAMLTHWIVLALAAGADIGAFAQIIELVMPRQEPLVGRLVVLGFTAAVLFLAHHTGSLLRSASADPDDPSRRKSSQAMALACFLGWLGLGLVAYWVRLTVPPPTRASLGGVVLGGGQARQPEAVADPHVTQGALLFLALYIATGLVALVSAYLTPPLRTHYRFASRAYVKAAKRAAASSHLLLKAQGVRESQETEIRNAAETNQRAPEEIRALADRLKQTARVEIAQAAQDPAVTDAIIPSP